MGLSAKKSKRTYDAFLCHNLNDLQVVRKFYEALKSKGLKIWFSEKDLRPGASLSEILEKIVPQTDCMLFACGSSGTGDWQKKEMSTYLLTIVSKGGRVIPVLLPGAKTKPILPESIREYVWVDLREGITGKSVNRLVHGIRGEPVKLESPPSAKRSAPRTADVRHRCYSQQILLQRATKVLTELKNKKGYDRLRLYLYNSHNLSIDGMIEMGGVGDNFRRIRIPICTDRLSQLLISDLGKAFLYVREEGKTSIEVYVGSEKGQRSRRLKIERPPQPHDLPALLRSGLRSWLDFPIVSSDRRFLGKLTVDSLWQQQAGQLGDPRKVFDPCDDETWFAIKEIASLFEQSNITSGHEFVDTEITSGTLDQAFRYATMQDEFRTLLAGLKSDSVFEGAFDRVRCYLSFKEFVKLFGRFAKNLRPSVPSHDQLGLIGFAEIGGVATVFTNVTLTEFKDECTRVLLGRVKASERVFQTALRAGQPVVFTSSGSRQNASSLPKRCFVERFYPPIMLDRRKPNPVTGIPGYLVEHMDTPILSSAKQIIGKISIDNKWHDTLEMPSLSDEQVRLLVEYAGKFAGLLEQATTVPSSDLCSTLDRYMSEVDDHRLGPLIV